MHSENRSRSPNARNARGKALIAGKAGEHFLDILWMQDSRLEDRLGVKGIFGTLLQRVSLA